MQPTNCPPALLPFLAIRVTRLEPPCGQVSWQTLSTNSGGLSEGTAGYSRLDQGILMVLNGFNQLQQSWAGLSMRSMGLMAASEYSEDRLAQTAQ